VCQLGEGPAEIMRRELGNADLARVLRHAQSEAVRIRDAVTGQVTAAV
jgi:hypothetical protein